MLAPVKGQGPHQLPLSKGITTLNKRQKQKINLLFIQNFNVPNLEMMINFIVLTEIGSDTHMTFTLGVKGRRG